MIEIWRVDTKGYLLKDEAGRMETDRFVDKETKYDHALIAEILKKTLFKLEDSESKKEFEEMMHFYIEKIASREHQLQEAFAHSLDARARLRDAEERKDSL